MAFISPRRFIIHVLLVTLIFFNISCSHVGLKYTGEYQSDLSGPGRVVVEKSYPVRWLAALCGGTFWAFGGFCWGYTIYPTDSMTEEVRNKAIAALGAQVPDYRLSKENLDPYQWKFMYENVHVVSGIDYKKLTEQEALQEKEKQKQVAQTAQSQNSKEQNNFDINTFEQSIVTKPSKNDVLFSGNDQFPTGWPEKWYFESPQYRYWTIVGDIKDNQSTAMASSAAKAHEVLLKEFPQKDYKETPHFETTHNYVKKINGKYQSWRIVRVSHGDVSQLVR
ncbi:MAG: hypothetical protein ACXVCY_04055 [Pseudobdellovibrionaceae bacterium]